MRIEISNYKGDVYINAGVSYVDDRVLTIGLDELPDEELVALTMKLVEKKFRALLVEARKPEPVTPEPTPGADDAVPVPVPVPVPTRSAA